MKTTFFYIGLLLIVLFSGCNTAKELEDNSSKEDVNQSTLSIYNDDVENSDENKSNEVKEKCEKEYRGASFFLDSSKEVNLLLDLEPWKHHIAKYDTTDYKEDIYSFTQDFWALNGYANFYLYQNDLNELCVSTSFVAPTIFDKNNEVERSRFNACYQVDSQDLYKDSYQFPYEHSVWIMNTENMAELVQFLDNNLSIPRLEENVTSLVNSSKNYRFHRAQLMPIKKVSQTIDSLLLLFEYIGPFAENSEENLSLDVLIYVKYKNSNWVFSELLEINGTYNENREAVQLNTLIDARLDEKGTYYTLTVPKDEYTSSDLYILNEVDSSITVKSPESVFGQYYRDYFFKQNFLENNIAVLNNYVNYRMAIDKLGRYHLLELIIKEPEYSNYSGLGKNPYKTYQYNIYDPSSHTPLEPILSKNVESCD